MILKHNETEMKLNRDESVFNTIIEKVNELIKDENTIFSHLVVDGVDVYENHEAYINEHLAELMKVEIVTNKATEMIWETAQSVRDYLERAIPALEKLVDESYEEFSQETWEGISQLIEGLQWMLQFKEFTQQSPRQPENWDEFAENFAVCEEQFTPLLDAIEAQDTILISDILAYEITPAYEEILASTEKMLQDTNFLIEMN